MLVMQTQLTEKSTEDILELPPLCPPCGQYLSVTTQSEHCIPRLSSLSYQQPVSWYQLEKKA